MTTPDFAAILALAIAEYEWRNSSWQAAAALAAKVPEACPDCHGDGHIHDGIGPSWMPCSHPHAPTIGTLLVWGWNVATARPEQPRRSDDIVWTSENCGQINVIDLLNALRTVEVQP